MENQMYQLVVYIPIEHIDSVSDALFDAGAGKYKKYDRCSFTTKGTGQFRPIEGSNPFIGSLNEVEKVEEYRVEMLCSKDDINAVRDALIKSHPYEEVAYHFIPIEM
jgi:hypothetical protein